MNGSTVSFMASVAVPNQSLENDCEEILKRFEVAGSKETADRLFQNIEIRLKSSRRAAARTVSAELTPRHRMPPLSGQMVARFGNAENIAALVNRFARMAYDIAISDDRCGQTDIVTSAVQDIFGSQRLAPCEIAAIVDAVSGAQACNMSQEVPYWASEVIRFLSFANVWQMLSVEHRRLIAQGPHGCHSGKVSTAGLVDGLKAFEKSWQGLSDLDQCLARINLGAMARQNLSKIRVVDAPDSLFSRELHCT